MSVHELPNGKACGGCSDCMDEPVDDVPRRKEPKMAETLDPDFASLLEREPSDASDSIEDWMQKCEDAAKRNLTLRATIDSQAARITELEGVLAAVRGYASALQNTLPIPVPSQLATTAGYATSIVSLINETLDPCKPWCVLEPGHGGACASDMEFCEDRDE